MKSAVSAPGQGLPGLQGLARWWADGLLAWLPARWRLRLRPAPQRLLLQVQDRQLQLWQGSGQEPAREKKQKRNQ